MNINKLYVKLYKYSVNKIHDLDLAHQTKSFRGLHRILMVSLNQK